MKENQKKNTKKKEKEEPLSPLEKQYRDGRARTQDTFQQVEGLDYGPYD